MTAYKRIAVLMGGRSTERDVSLSSGRGVMKALAEEGVEPISVDPGDNPGQQLWEAKPDAVFLRKGDVMTLGIEGLGEQRQLVVPFKL